MYSSKSYKYFLTVAIAILFNSCANIGTPSGGEYDLEAPRVVGIRPAARSTDVTQTNFTFEFDENVILLNPSEKVIITPPQKNFPVIRSANRRVSINLRDSLIPNMTYTIDFTDAITDNNEGNVLEDFSYSFSTGSYIDSLAVSGVILSADNLEPIKGMFVGLHSNLADSAFTKMQFERISRTNDAGKFTIRGIFPGEYRIYALDDLNRDYKYDNPDESIAYLDTILAPSTMKAQRQDTVRHVHGDLTVDSITTVGYTRFTPDNIVLRAFKSDFKRKYLVKTERLEKTVSIFFGAPTDLPKIEPLNFDLKGDGLGILEKTLRNDTLTYWLADEKLLAQDTLRLKLTYLETDSLSRDYLRTDTLSIFDRTRKKEKKKDSKEIEEEKKIEFIEIATNIKTAWDIYAPISLTFSEPLRTSLKEHLVLQQQKDSVYTPINIELRVDSLNPRKYWIDNKWEYEADYKLNVDSAALHGIYGLWNNKLESKFKVKKLDEYGNLALYIEGIDDSIPAFVELLNKSDSPVRSATVRKGNTRAAIFKNIPPGTYYARIILDTNENGKWDTGDYHTKLQPELVCYYNEFFDIKAYFDIQQTWRVDTEKLAGQKPVDITKNKPVDKEEKIKKMQELEEKRKRDGNR